MRDRKYPWQQYNMHKLNYKTIKLKKGNESWHLHDEWYVQYVPYICYTHNIHFHGLSSHPNTSSKSHIYTLNIAEKKQQQKTQVKYTCTL